MQDVTSDTPEPNTKLYWTICPGCRDRQDSQDTAPCNICGRSNSAILYQPPTSSIKFRKWMLRPLGWLTHGWTLSACFLALRILAVDGVDSDFLMLTSFFWMALCAAWSTRFLFWLGYLLPDFRRRYRRPGWSSFAVLPSCVIVLILASSTHLVPRVLFLIFQPGFERIANLPAQTPVKTPFRVGPYMVSEVSRYNGNVSFTVARCSFLFTETRGGFTYSSAVSPTLPAPSSAFRHVDLAPHWYWWGKAYSTW